MRNVEKSGYGLNTDIIQCDLYHDENAASKVYKLIDCAPKYAETFRATVGSDADIDTLLSFDDDENCENGIGKILQQVILETEGIHLCLATDNESCYQYLIFEPKYPWSEMTKQEHGLYSLCGDAAQEKLDSIFAKYVNIVDDVDIVDIVDIQTISYYY